jgi:hypothetical protein
MQRSYETPEMAGDMHIERARSNTMKKAYFLALFGLLLGSSLRVFAANISTGYDHSANFSE